MYIIAYRSEILFTWSILKKRIKQKLLKEINTLNCNDEIKKKKKEKYKKKGVIPI